MIAFYTDSFVLPLPEGHRFPMVKYRRLRERCVAEGVLGDGELCLPEAASWEELALVHGGEYLDRVRTGGLTPAEQRRIGFPWSLEMVERSRRSVGGTIGAARKALGEGGGSGWGVAVNRSEAEVDGRRSGWGVAVNLAGGTHHAYPDHGEGFCVFNDAAVAVRVHQRAGRIARALVVDCDVHQGNGTAAVFRTDPTVFTFSIHGARNFPFRKVPSALDIALPDGAGDETFLAALDLHLPHLLEDFAPDLVVYLSGADPFGDDRFGRLSLTKAGLAARDRLVLGLCRDRRTPTAVVMAGGYARDTEDTVDIHLATVRIAAELAGSVATPAAGD